MPHASSSPKVLKHIVRWPGVGLPTFMSHTDHTDGEWFRNEKIKVKGILKEFSVNTNGTDGVWETYTVWIGSKLRVTKAKTAGYVM